MTSRAVSRWLSNQLIRAAMQVSPRERAEWAQAMSREVDEIPSDREALRWALGCLHASCHERLKSMRLTNWWPVRWGMALWIALLAVDSLFYVFITLTYKLGLFTLSSEFPVARSNTALGADAFLSCRCDVSLGDCSHIEAQSGCAWGRRGTLRHHAIAIRGPTQPARVRYPAESFNSLPTIAFRIDMADRRFGNHDCDLPCTVA